jgi:hypothetical protein
MNNALLGFIHLHWRSAWSPLGLVVVVAIIVVVALILRRRGGKGGE